jgi:hypothetical protein
MTIWKEKRVLLAILGLLLAANTFFFFTYRVQYEKRLRDLDDRREQSETRLTQARSARMAAEGRVAAYRRISRDVEDVYTQQWATEAERLAALIREVKRLAAASQLPSRSYSFVREGRAGASDDAKVGAEVVGISFSVHGNYRQVRRLINLLELSRQFVIIDSIALSSSENDNLTLTLHLKTLFRDTSAGRKL